MAEEAAERGVCRYCGCTDALRCPEGCWWIDFDASVCSARACVDRYFAAYAETGRRILQAMLEGG